MYTVEQRDRVHELTDVPFPAAGAPNPLVLADESTLVVAYISATAGASLVVFKQCYASHFGVPNDGAFASHLLAKRALPPYGAFEVKRTPPGSLDSKPVIVVIHGTIHRYFSGYDTGSGPFRIQSSNVPP